jgi:DNA-binding MarR family transcriptional regulator
MLQAIFGNKTAAMVMLYLFHYGEAYANGLARDMKITLSQVQKQLDKFEQVSLLVKNMELSEFIHLISKMVSSQKKSKN